MKSSVQYIQACFINLLVTYNKVIYWVYMVYDIVLFAFCADEMQNILSLYTL